MQPSWLEQQIGRAIGYVVGDSLHNAIDFVADRMAPATRTGHALRRQMGNPALFAATLTRAPYDIWARPGAEQTLRDLDEQLAMTPGKAAALSRATLHDYFTQHDMWGQIPAVIDFDKKNDDISARLYSGYMQLMRHAEGATLSRRTENDFRHFLSHAQYYRQPAYSKAINALVDTAQTHPALHSNWSEAQVSQFCSALDCMDKPASMFGLRDLRLVHPNLLSRHVLTKAQISFDLSYGYKMLTRLPTRLDHNASVLAVYGAMVAAVQSGIPLTLPAPKDAEDRIRQRELKKLLSAQDPWRELGRRMVTLRDDARARNSLRDLMRLELAAKPAKFLDDATRDRLLGGVQCGLHTILKAKKRGSGAYAAACLETLYGYAAFVDTRTGSVMNTLCSHFRKAAQPHQMREKCPMRTMISDPFTVLARYAPARAPMRNSGDMMLVDAAQRGLTPVKGRIQPFVDKPTAQQLSRLAAALVI